MINISKLYCGLPGQSDELRYGRAAGYPRPKKALLAAESTGPVVVYNCTQKCNLDCLHCYNPSSNADAKNELSTDDAVKLLSQLAEAKCPVVLFSGGEPLLRDDIFILLAAAKRFGLQSVISSNGTVIDTAVALHLAQLDVSYVGVSIDGNEKFHDKFRRKKWSYKAAEAGIENCRNAGIKTGLRFTITKANSEQIPGVFESAATMGIKRLCFYHLIRSGRAKQLEDYIPTPEQTRQVMDTIIEQTTHYVKQGLVDEVLTVGNHPDGPYLLVKMKQEKNKRYKKAKQLLRAAGGNKTGKKIACIGPDGRVHADQFWQNYSLGNVKEKHFMEIWENPKEPVLKKLRSKDNEEPKHGKKRAFVDPRCRECKWFELCKGNFRFLGPEADDKHWVNEPACYLTDKEIGIK